MGFQNNEIIDSNSLVLAIKKLIKKRREDGDVLSSKILFEGKPSELLDELNEIAKEEGIDIYQK